MLNIIIGLLVFTLDLNMKSCDSMDVNISGYFNDCIDQGDAQHELIFEVDNQSGSTFYVYTADLFYKMELINKDEMTVLPSVKGEIPMEPEFILIEQGRHKYQLALSVFDRYDLKEDKYWLHVYYKNTQKSIRGRELLIGEYEIPKIEMNICE